MENKPLTFSCIPLHGILSCDGTELRVEDVRDLSSVDGVGVEDVAVVRPSLSLQLGVEGRLDGRHSEHSADDKSGKLHGGMF